MNEMLKPSTMFEFQQVARVNQQDQVDLQISRYVDELLELILKQINKVTNSSGIIDSAAWILSRDYCYGLLEKFGATLDSLIDKGFEDSFEIVIGAFAFYHNSHFLVAVKQSKLPESAQESLPFVENHFRNLQREIVQAVKGRYENDGLRLSDRIWKVSRDQRKILEQLILQAIVDETPVQELANRIQAFTGVIEWQALRLARNEIQTVYQEAVTQVFAKMPYVELVQLTITQERHKPDICDTYRASSKIGNGKFKVGELKLPIHPNCMCFWRPILVGVGELTNKIKLWKNGKATILSLSTYQQLLGGNISINLDGEYFQKIYSWV